MRGRVAVGLALVLVAGVAGATAAGDPGSDVQTKQSIDARVERLRAEIADANASEGVLTSQLSELAGQLREAQARVDVQQARLDALEATLAAARGRLRHAQARVRETAAALRVAQRLDRVAEARLERRVREVYMHRSPDTLSVLLSATSFSDLLDDVAYVRRLGQLDRRIAGEAARARADNARANLIAVQARRGAAARTREIAERTTAARAVRDRLAASRNVVAAARNVKAEALASAHENEQAYLDEVRALQAQSAALAVRIRVAQASSSGFQPQSAGTGQLQWPVSGPVTSGFGVRWGRLHEGIDIAVPSGTPVHAAADGRVVYAGWMEGYGNLVVLDHGNGLSTAYGHNTSVAVAVGQDVAAGAVIAYSGSTGHSTGPHVHFEVRVNGAPVDPMGYL